MLGVGGGSPFGPAPFLLGGRVGAAKSLLPSFLVPKGNQPTACTLALWWLKFGPTEAMGGGGVGNEALCHGTPTAHRCWSLLSFLFEFSSIVPVLPLAMCSSLCQCSDLYTGLLL